MTTVVSRRTRGSQNTQPAELRFRALPTRSARAYLRDRREQAVGARALPLDPTATKNGSRNPGPEGQSYEWMTTALTNRAKSVKSATSAPLPAKTAASCAATEATST